MSTIPAPKRRRFNTTSSALSKPFKSPVRTTPPQAHQISPTPHNPPEPSTILHPPPTPTPYSKHPTTPLHLRNIRTPASPQLAILQKRHTALLRDLAAARASLETHVQALKLETSSTDKELEVLTVTWMMAGRAAAEEVFGLVAKRVEGMGGVGAWRAKEKEKREGGGLGGGWGWDAPRQEKEGDEDDGETEDVDERERETEAVANEGDEEEVNFLFC